MSLYALAELDAEPLWRAIEAAAEVSRFAVLVARVDCTPSTIVYASPHAIAISGRTEQELIGAVPWVILREADQRAMQDLVGHSDPRPSKLDVTVAQPGGTEVPITLAATRVTVPAGVFVLGLFRDLVTEHQAIATLRASENRFRFVVESAPDGVVILVRGAIVFMNPRAATLLGARTPDDALGRRIAEFLPPEDARLATERITEMFRTGRETPPNEYRTVHDPNRLVEIKSVCCDWEGQPAVLAFARDVTERNAIQRRMVEADRLAALGTLAAGVAHEINNPLTYTQLNAQGIERWLARPEMPPEAVSAIREHLREIDHGIARVASITQGLRSFARDDEAAPRAVDLAATLEQALKMVDHDLRHRAHVERRFEDVEPVIANASRLEQVLVNLLLNAIQALPADGMHTIDVTIAPRGASSVIVAITDTGRGISEGIRGRIFDPFFTTRPIGEGMGLGLAVSKTIVEGFGGSIEVESTPGVGTTMTVVLRTHQGRSNARHEPTAAVRSKHRRILVIDDERLVRDALQRLLSASHAVAIAEDGASGLAELARATFDVILCDVMMPGMNGDEVYKRIAASWPGLERRVVFMSGGTFTAELDAFLGAVPNRLLTKPFKLADIEVAIAAVG